MILRSSQLEAGKRPYSPGGRVRSSPLWLVVQNATVGRRHRESKIEDIPWYIAD